MCRSFLAAVFCRGFVLLLLCCPFSGPVFGQEGQAIGRVVTTTGSVTARDPAGAQRSLTRRSDIFVGDTVITGPNGFAQIRMVDSAQISFKADTEFTFSEYSSDGPGGAADNAVMSLVRGGFRTISGSIGEDSTDQYQISTQFANIGIRGTTHEAVIDAGSLLTGVYDGGTTISNAQGSLDTGVGANFDYSRTFPGQAPQGLLQQPVQLGQINLNPGLANGDNGDGDDGAADGDGADGNDGAADGNDGNDGNDGGADGNDGNAGGALAGNDDNGTAPPPPANNTNNDGNLGGFNTIAQTSTDPGVDPDATRTVDINPVTNVRTRSDFEVTGVGDVGGIGFLAADEVDSTRERLGFILSRNLSPGAIFPGNITSLQSGQDVLLIGNDLTVPRTVSEAPNFIFRGAGGFVDFIDGSVIDADQGGIPYEFEAGLWGSSSNPVSLFKDFEDSSTFDLFENPFVVVSVSPAPLASLSGEVVYLTNFDRYIGGSSLGGGIHEFFTAFNVDFSAGLITDGTMEFCIGGDSLCNGSGAQFWDLDYSGTVREGYVVAQPVSNSGRINGDPASIYGLIEGIFTGDNAEAFVGGFNLFYDPDLDEFLGQGNNNNIVASAVGLPETLVDGIFLLEQERRTTRAEIETLDDDAFLVQEGYARIFLGYSRPTSLGGSRYDNSIFFVDSRSRPRIALRDPDFSVSVSRVNQNLAKPVSDFFEVDWERWQGPLLTYTDNLDETAFTDGADDGIDDLAFFSTFRVSHLNDVQGHYDQVLGFLGENNSGAQVSALEMSFDINFSAATSQQNISNGKLFLKTGSSEGWMVFFDGSLLDNSVEFNLLASDPGGSGNSSGIYNASNSLVASLDRSDSNMQGVILSGYDFQGSETPALLSSFYFREANTSASRRRVSGLSLVALDDIRFLDVAGASLLDLNQYEAARIADSNGNVGMINIPGFNGTLETVLGLDPYAVLNNQIDIFALDSEVDPGYDSMLEIYDLNQTFGEMGASNTFSTSNSNYFLQMAYWNNVLLSGDFSEFASMNGSSTFQSAAFRGPAFWNNFSPTVFPANLSGRFSKVLQSFGTIAYNNPGDNVAFFGPVDNFKMEFDVDFSTGDIMYGSLLASTPAADYASSGIEYNWSASFDGSITSGNVSLNLLYAKFYQSFNGDPIAYYDAVSSSGGTADILADFTGDTLSPILTGAYQFDFTDSSFTAAGAGNFATTGVVDARLNTSQLYEMEHHLALLVEGAYVDSSSNLIPGSLSLGRASHPVYSGGTSPFIGINNRGTQSILNADTSQPFEEVLTGTSTAMTDLGAASEVVESSTYEVALGYWDSASMSILHNQLDPSQVSMLNHDVFWANVIPADIANMTGTYSYSATGDFIGYSSYSDDQLYSFAMGFDIDFTNGIISNGSLNAGSGFDSWSVAFTGGNLNGSIAEFTGISGDFYGYGDSCMSCVTGSIGGIFTDTYYSSTPGFAAGFTLNNSLGSGFADFIQGVGVLEVPAI